MNPEQELHLAIQENDRKKVEELLDSGVDINCLFYAYTPLQHAIHLGFEDLGLYLIERGADIYKQHNKSDASPLEGAVKKKLKRIIAILLEKGADPNMSSTTGDPLIYHSLERDYIDILRLLVQGKVNTNTENSQGVSPLFLAAKINEPKVCQVLLEGGADVNFQYSQLQNQTPLIVATANELTDVVKVLLKNGCNVNLQDSDGWTALWHAYSNSDEELMTFLLKSGADKDSQNSDGKTVLQDAKENEDDDIVELLQKFSRAWTT